MLLIFIGLSVGLKSKVESPTKPEMVQEKKLKKTNVTPPIAPDTKSEATSNTEPDTNTKSDTEDLETIDTIKLVVMNAEDTEIITLSDLDRPNITGVQETLQDKLDAALVFLETILRNIIVTDEEIDRDFIVIRKNNNMTQEELDNLFIEMGSTPKKMRAVFKKIKASKMLIDHIIRSHLVVPKKAIIAYYEQHPEWLEVSYTLQRAFIPHDNVKNDIIEADDVVWSLPFTVLESDLAEDKYIIKNLSLEEISAPIKTDDGFELFYLVGKQERRLKTLEERYAAIADILRKPRYIELVNEFMQELKAKSYVQYL